MRTPKEQQCFNCGESLGFYVADGYEPECCGARECQRELRDQMMSAEAERQERGAEDHYDRY